MGAKGWLSRREANRVAAEMSVERALVVQRVIALWESQRGWIPGGAYRELAEALGVSTDRLTHYDTDLRRHIGPPDHVYSPTFAVLDGALSNSQCYIWVNGERCAKTSEEHTS